jgi:hypothetical protein
LWFSSIASPLIPSNFRKKSTAMVLLLFSALHFGMERRLAAG